MSRISYYCYINDYYCRSQMKAVKIINDELQHSQKLTDFLNSYTTSIESYRMIRKEVLFLSTLCHQNLTQLCGVCTHPFMLLIELAPLGSLSSILICSTELLIKY